MVEVRNDSEVIAMRKGFTIIELLVVIALMMILLGIIRPMLSVSASKSREYECESHLKQVGMAVNAYLEDYGEFPAKLDYVDSILQDKSLLKCPATARNYYYKVPAKAMPMESIASCVRLKSRGKWPHRFGDCCLSLNTAGGVRKVLK